MESGLDAFLVSTGVVALAEIGDKTQLLAFIISAKFRRPMPIILGILVATLFNHGFAGAGRSGCYALDPRRVISRHGGLDADP